MNWIEVIKQEKRKHAGTWSLCILLTVAVGMIQSFVLVYLLKRIVETALRDGYVQIMLLLFLGIVFSGTALEILRQGVRFRFLRAVTYSLENRLIDCVYQTEKKDRCDKIFALVQNTVSKLAAQYTDTVLKSWSIAAAIIVITSYTLFISREAVVICFAVTGIGMLFMRSSNRKISEASQKSSDTFNQVYLEIMEYLKCSEMLPFLDVEAYKEFEKRIQDNQISQIELAKCTNIARICTRFSNVGIVLIASAYFGTLAILGRFSITDLLAIIMLLPALADALFMIPNQMANYKKVVGMGDSMKEFLEAVAVNFEEKGQAALGRITEIKAQNLAFSYDKEKEHCNVKEFLAASGQVIGIYGKSGSGKTTFLKILIKELGDFTGECLVNGRDIREIAGKELWERILYLSQEPVLLPLSVKENIALTDSERLDIEKVRRSLRLADLEGLVNTYEEKENHMLRKGSLSSGEIQKLCFARCFYTDKDVIILDEATSAMSPNAEQKVLRNLMEEVRSKKKILILISHNSDVTAMCDSVLYMSPLIPASNESGIAKRHLTNAVRGDMLTGSEGGK